MALDTASESTLSAVQISAQQFETGVPSPSHTVRSEAMPAQVEMATIFRTVSW